MSVHVPVLLDEVVDLMNVQPAGIYIDATYGRGGHARALLGALGDAGRLVVCDRDPQAIADATSLAAADPRVEVHRMAFSGLAQALAGLRGRVAGMLVDLGISSPQVDDPSRGFSFRHDGPLDMRMDPTTGVSAATWLATADEQEIADVLWRYGEERHSRRIARRIVESRTAHPLETTFDLAALVSAAIGRGGGRIDPATRTFQAIRIRINDELGEVERLLDTALDLLAVGGRLLIIAFHSLEDRLVKQRFRALEQDYRDARRAGPLPVPTFHEVTRKPVMASAAETTANPRARSARLRVLERLA